jgi:hypothetical protein
MTKLQRSKMHRIEKCLYIQLKRGLKIPGWTYEYYALASKILAPTVRKMSREAYYRAYNATTFRP